ncbi:MAG: sulfotransferase [Hyphomonadaceae bacterium]|nr:sulfotransferase [Hyphomonadaceae bacterium]
MPPAQPPEILRLQKELDAAIKAHQAGRIDEAEAVYIKVLERVPTQADALNLLGVIQAEKNRNERALDLLQRAARVRPKDGVILNNLGRAAVRSRRFELAIESLERSIALAPEVIEAYGNLIQAHRQAGNITEAEYFVEVLRAKRGGSVTADFEHARILSDLGRKQEARALLVKLTTETPGYAPAWQSLARLSKVKAGDPIIDGIVDIIGKTSEPSTTMRFLCYAAGKIFDDLGEFDRAFEYVSRAKRQDPPTYDPEKTKTQFTTIASVFNENFINARRDWGVESERPVFIVGMPRSGTTLAEQILASHPEVFGGGELEYIGQATAGLADFAPSGRFPTAAVGLPKEIFASLGYRYLRKIGALNQAAARCTDKMPHNFMSLGLLRIMFQNLRVVHCMRHPFDTILSCFQHDFAHTHDYNQSLEGLASYYACYRELMEHWAEVMPDAIHPLQYEKMIENQEDQSRGLIKAAGLEWDDRVLAFAETDRRVSTPSSWQVRQPLYSSSSGRWKNYERHLAPILGVIPERFFP